jgi:hypothetical protein
MSVNYLQSAQGALVVDISTAGGGAGIGSAIQMLDKKPESNQWWTKQPVPGWPGYFWIQSASELVLDIDNGGGIKSGSRLQALNGQYETNQYWQTVDVPDQPGYFWIVSAVDGLVIDIDNTGGVKSGSRLQVLEKKNEENQYWKWVEAPAVPAPSGGLQSSSNYFFYGGKTASGDYIPLLDIGIEITITEDLVGSPPCSFQLNALSPKKSPASGPQFLDVWQQYGISWIPGSNQLNSFANNWSKAGLDAGGENDFLFNIEPDGFVTLANQTTIPKGSIITISLNFLPPTPGTIGGSYVEFATKDGAQPVSQLINIVDWRLSEFAGGGTATYDDLAPIAALQLVLVGFAGKKDTTFSSGAGTIRYSSSTPMHVIAAPPTDVERVTFTGEQSNSTYGTLPAGTSSIYVQSFAISTEPRIAHHSEGHARPSRFL